MLKRLVGEELGELTNHGADDNATDAVVESVVVEGAVVEGAVVQSTTESTLDGALLGSASPDAPSDTESEPRVEFASGIGSVEDYEDAVIDATQVVQPEVAQPEVIDTDLLFDGAAEDDNAEEELAPVSIWSQLTSGDSQAFMLSLIVHTVLILSLALIPVLSEKEETQITLTALAEAEVPEVPEDLSITEDLAF
ncbi:MAG: hypothetical protein IT423_20360, partial [Pirellulaceae bacterium]|nr:hypothetical protein [Pirellulaceae bacterium]